MVRNGDDENENERKEENGNEQGARKAEVKTEISHNYVYICLLLLTYFISLKCLMF